MASEGSAAEQNQNLAAQLQTAITQLVDFRQQTQDTLNGFKEYQKSSIAKFNNRLERKRKMDDVQFKNIGNEDQYNHEKRVMESMDDIEESLNENKLEDAKKALKSERYWEHEETEQVSVAGKIREHAKFWEFELKAPSFILDIVKNGYSLPFKKNPPPSYSKNNKSSLREHKFVKNSIEELVKNKCIREVDFIPYCVNPLSVAERNSKLRLVLDLRNVNKYIDITKFKYDNIKTLSDLVNPGDLMFTFDLKSGYHHVPINEDFHRYLGFSWEFKGITKYFVFVVLPFGLCSACWVFTKLMRQLVKKWRGQGMKSVMYLDDGVACGYPESMIVKHRDIMAHDLKSAGLTINVKKSSLEPETEKEWLGFRINTEEMKIYVPLPKLEAVLRVIAEILTSDLVTTRKIAKLAGRIIAMSIAIGPLTRLFTRKMYKFIDDRIMLGLAWDSNRLISKELKSELTFWKSNLSASNGVEFNTSPVITKVCYSDASEYAYGGFIVERLGNIIAHGIFLYPNQIRVQLTESFLLLKTF
eukprot:TCONS_00018130-protein